VISRRNLVLGAACLATAAGAYELKPHHRFTLLGNRKMENIVPTTFGSWAATTEENLVKPETLGKLASRLYSEMVERIYVDSQTGAEVMMLIAYGDTQSDLLQLHRPEACYPAVGFQLLSSRAGEVMLGPDAPLQGRRVAAQKGERHENIFYWTRLGEYLPVDENDQRKARLLTAMKGLVPDGGLFRFSALGADIPASFKTLDRLVSALVLAVAPSDRPALISTGLAKKLAV
jgi:EpsI family protein